MTQRDYNDADRYNYHKNEMTQYQDTTALYTLEPIDYLYSYIPIKIATNITSLKSVVTELLEHKPSYLGIDLEWKPNFVKNRKENKVALVQIAHEKLIILIQVHKFTNVLKAFSISGLLKLFKNKNILKCGVGIVQDKEKIYRDHGIIINKCIELNHLNLHPNNTAGKYLGLHRLYQKVVQCDMKYKDKKITMSNWERSNLTWKQILYAAEDAFVGYAICDQLLRNSIDATHSKKRLLQDIDHYMDRKILNPPLERLRKEMIKIGRTHSYFHIDELHKIFYEIYGYGIRNKYKGKWDKLVIYFDDIFYYNTHSGYINSN